MYPLTPSIILAISSIITRTLIALARSNWLIAWVSIEINLLRFIPIICRQNNNQESEGAIKYFLAQALGSAVILLSSIYLWSTFLPATIIQGILIISLLLKLGAAPCHFWFPSVITSISWTNCLILVTWQKLAPLALLSYTLCPSYKLQSLFACVAGLNAILGGCLGLNQTHIRTILAYSSITHIGWIISALSINIPNLRIIYLLIYSLIVLPIFMILNHNSVHSSQQFSSLTLYSKYSLVALAIILISLAGLPPLTGFLPKWLIISYLISYNQTIIFLLLIGSYLNLYFYLNLVFSLISSSVTNIQTAQTTKSRRLKFILLAPGTSLLGIIPIIIYALTLLYKS